MPERRLSKLQLSIKYEWEEKHSANCECLYCVMMEELSRKHEMEQSPRARRLPR